MEKTIRVLKPCDTCNDWSDCLGHFYQDGVEYYYIDEIKQYCRYQVRWLITEFLNCNGDFIVAERYTWPEDIYASGYTEAERTSHQQQTHPPQESVQLVVGELEVRLEATGKDGQLLVCQIRNGSELGKPARDAFSYSLGEKRKRKGYRQWLADREYRARQKR